MEDMPKKRVLSANDVGDWFINAVTGLRAT